MDVSWRDIPVVAVSAPVGGTGVGYAALRAEAGHEAVCGPEPLSEATAIPGPDLDAPSA
jgi:hypothetical protein